MVKTRVQINSIVENQIPSFIREDFPLAAEFLKEYYRSQEIDGAPYDLLQNIDQYLKSENLSNIVNSTIIHKDDDSSYSVDLFDNVIYVKSTEGFPDSYGLIKIDEEIITYKSKSTNSFNECIRGFSGVENLKSNNNPEKLVFSTSEVATHSNGSNVVNLSILFLKEFLQKLKRQISPGFENRSLNPDVNERLFLSRVKDFYTSKGTDESFKLLFKSLYGTDVKIIKPRDFLIQPSDAGYRVTKDIVVESISGNPTDLVNRTLFQDSDGFILRSYGSVTNVEKFTRAGKEYYILSLDYDFDKDISVSGSIFGEFNIHPKTISTTDTEANSSTLTVDSTIGFPKKGSLIIKLNTGNTLNVQYDSKTFNQFLQCSNITEQISAGQEILYNTNAYAYVDTSLNQKIQVRICGVLSEINIPNNTYQYEPGDSAKIVSLGITDNDDIRLNNWLFNIPIKYDVEKTVWLNSVSVGEPQPLNYKHEIFTYDENIIYDGNQVELDIVIKNLNNSLEPISRVKKTFTVESVSIPSKSFVIINDHEIIKTYTAKKLLTKVIDYDYPANIQNTYRDSDLSTYVTSQSLPNYSNQKIDIRNRSIEFSGTFGNPITGIKTDTIVFKGPGGSLRNHGFLSGDSVVYIPGSGNNTLSIPKNVYFVKKIDLNTIKISNSRENVDNNIFITFNGSVTNNKFLPFEFVDENLNEKQVESQKLVRKISEPKNDGKIYNTTPGFLGIFSNGVEILNYKSSDVLYYGKIKSIDVLSGGSNYDVINPPILEITDSVGVGASGICSVNGSLTKINIIDPGFDYINDPKVVITGGNGFGAKAKVNLISIDHLSNFNSEEISGLVNLVDNSISFNSPHKFRDNEKVYYITNNQTPIGGLIENSIYYLSVQNSNTVKLHKTLNDSVTGINTIPLTSYGFGIHAFKSFNKKKVVGSITVINPGSGYRNRKIVVYKDNINLESSTIVVQSHGFSSGEIIKYAYSNSPIGGLTDSSYIVTKIDDNSFKLSLIDPDNKDFYYKTKQFVVFNSLGNGEHYFSYPDISVKIVGTLGISGDYSAKIQPVFRGSIDDIFITNGGTKYGSEEIINLHKKPSYRLKSGKDANLKPVISNGRITDVLILNPGVEYNSPPDIIVSGSGIGAVITPLITNGRITGVKIINGGYNYNPGTTSIIAKKSGENCKLDFKIQSWTINLIERLKLTNQISTNDGIISNGLANQYGLQYCHGYIPKKLREILFTKNISDDNIAYRSDFENDFSGEKYHSPIIGWCYDGNPIYGPYGYENISGGQIKQMISGYSNPVIKPERPPISIFPLGFFVEDYEFIGNGDLDQHNGRFCRTPEFPNGTYAYFCSLDESINNKQPKFPYIIGDSFRSTPIKFNYQKQSNQDELDVNSINWLRNTKPYNLNSDTSSYEYLTNPNKIKQQITNVTNSSLGKVEDVIIIKGGENYKVGDIVSFNNDGTGGYNAYAEVNSVYGKEVSKIVTESEQIIGAEIIPSNNSREYIVYCNSPHNIKNTDIVTISGVGTYFSSLEGSYQAKVYLSNLVLANDVGDSSITGIVTYFNVYGNLNDTNIRENDIYEIGTENVKVLNIDKNSSRIRVLRQSGITAHTSGDALVEVSRKFRLNVGQDLNYQYKINKELYINPKESLGVGTVGFGTTAQISNPGVGDTQLFLPIRSIYIPNHKLNNNDRIKYNTNGNDSIIVSDGYKEFNLSEVDSLFVVKLSDSSIGISTNTIGIGSTGSFVGIGTDTSLLYFTSYGTGLNHSFNTQYQSTVSANISKKTVVVTTLESHNLALEDNVTINCNSYSTKTIKIKYNSKNKRIIVNPDNFASSDINLQNSSITIQNHDYVTSEKVIYTSDSPSGGLVNNKIYYVITVDSNTIKLADTYYNSKLNIPINITITSQSSGEIARVNPQISIFKSNTIIFDTSDESLSVASGSTRIPKFEFKLFKDSNFTDEFVSTTLNDEFEVLKYGDLGTTNSITQLKLTDNIPSILYYTLIPLYNLNDVLGNNEIINDNEFIINANKISIKESLYNGTYKISNVTDKTFSYTIQDNPEVQIYTSGVRYYTSSKFVSGSIHNISVKSGGNGYKKLPFVENIITDNGFGAVLLTKSNSIGKIKDVKILDIGFDYSVDQSVRPYAKFPDILKIEPLSSFNTIEVVYKGIGYDVNPDIVVLDGSTKQLVDDVILTYDVSTSTVKIIKNSTGFYNSEPIIIPVNNPNGVGINTINFDQENNIVTVTLNSEFSDLEDFPFEIGDEVLVENISIVEDSGTGYNSSDYGYKYFIVTNVDKNIGGSGSIVEYELLDSTNPGVLNPINSYGKIVPVKHFPRFKSTLKKNEFLEKEYVFTEDSEGFVEKWDSQNEYLKVETNDFFKVNSIIKGKTSGSQGIITIVNNFSTTYKVDSTSIVRKGWTKETGILNNNTQRIHNSDYYQYFSYSIKSQVPYEKWNDSVSTLNHTLGFKKFSDLSIESYDQNYSGINTSQDSGDFLAISDLSSIIDVDCYYDFDLVSENNLVINQNTLSNEIIFNSRELKDYSESIGNRVLKIDDISPQFNHLPRLTPYSIIDTFKLDTGYSRKYITYIKDKRYTDERQIMLVTALHDNNYQYLNQYARLDTYGDLGSFDISINGNEANLLFYPNKFEFNDYDVSFTNYTLSQVNSGIGSTPLGDIVLISTSTYDVPADTSQNIVTLPTSHNSIKILIEFVGNNGKFEFDELSILHDNTNIYMIEYGQLSNTFSTLSNSGFGTYHAYISNDSLIVDYIPSISGLGVSITTFITSLDSNGVTPGQESINNTLLESSNTLILSSETPVPTSVSNYHKNEYECGYYVVSIHDKTNNEYQMQEIVIVNDSTDTYISEYAVLETNNTLGSFSVNNTSPNFIELEFTPIPNIEVNIAVYQNALKLENISSSSIQI